jgi:hypothetical protein
MRVLPSLVFGLFILSFSSGAAAYLDPGTGSMILQGLIAGIAVAWFTIKTYWYRIIGVFGKGRPSSVLDDEPDKVASEERA